MISIKEGIEKYLELRRKTGYALNDVGFILRDFGCYMEKKGDIPLSADIAIDWAQSITNVQPSRIATRLSAVRCFANFWKNYDDRTIVPPKNILPSRKKSRAAPYIYTEEEILNILHICTNHISDNNGIRWYTYYTFFGLIAATGMRVSEGINLKISDIDFLNNIILIKKTKFYKTRAIPVDGTVIEKLNKYYELRKNYTNLNNHNFFIYNKGTTLTVKGVEWIFLRILDKAGIRPLKQSRGPRIHDLRHTFAVKTILNWYKKDIDVDKNIMILSTYLGHTEPADTYWYLTLTKEILQYASNKLENYLRRTT